MMTATKELLWMPPEDLYLPTEVLGGWGKYGLRLLAQRYKDQGNDDGCKYWLEKAQRVELVPIASLELAGKVASGLNELAEFYVEDGDTERSHRWKALGSLVVVRALSRERVALGLPEK